jgi:hypothetical protein
MTVKRPIDINRGCPLYATCLPILKEETEIARQNTNKIKLSAGSLGYLDPIISISRIRADSASFQ